MRWFKPEATRRKAPEDPAVTYARRVEERVCSDKKDDVPRRQNAVNGTDRGFCWDDEVR